MNDRGRGARHPLQLGCMGSLLWIGISQLFTGPIQSTPISQLADPTQRLFAGLLILSAVLVLVGGILPEPRCYWIEISGQVGAVVTLMVYVLTLRTTVPQWNTSMGSGYLLVAAGCFIRLLWLAILIVANDYPKLFRRFARAYVELSRACLEIRAHLALAKAAIVKQWRR
jgi:hypothetical protein